MSETKVRQCRCTHGDDAHEDGNWFCSLCDCTEFMQAIDGVPTATFSPLPPEPVPPPPPELDDTEKARRCLRDIVSLSESLGRQVVSRWCRVIGATRSWSPVERSG